VTTTMGITTPISIPHPQSAEPTLRLRLGPCRLRVTPGDGPEWVSGGYEDRGNALPIEVRVEGTTATIAQRFDPASFTASALPTLELAIDRTQPFRLVIETGAGDHAFDLGGLPVVSFEMKAGAGRYDLDFSKANPVEMRSMELSTGAGQFSARRLANAGFTHLKVGTGVAGCTLDFSGELTRDASVRIDAGLASVELTVPAATAMRLRSKGFAAGTEVTGPITRERDEFRTPPAVADGYPLLSIEASIAFGQLSIRAVEGQQK